MKFRHLGSDGLLLLLGAGLLVRILLAYVIFPDSGYASDTNWYVKWALSVSDVGPGRFYEDTVVNYPPGYIYILWVVGSFGLAISPLVNVDALRITALLVKVPPMLLDLLVGLLLYRTTKSGISDKSPSERLASFVAASYLFNPAVLYDSAIWGQADAAGAFLLLLGVISLMKYPPEVSASVAIIAGLTKPQFGVVLIPLAFIVLLRRHAIRGIGEHVTSGWAHWNSSNGPVRLATSAAAALLIFYVLAHPFGLDLHSYFERMTNTAQQYNFLSVDAFNPWALVGAGGHRALAFSDIDNLSVDDIPLIGSYTGVAIGTVLLAIGFMIGAARLIFRSDQASIALVGAYLCLCFFLLPTRVHERYLVPIFSLSSLMIAFDRKWLWANFLLAIGSFINLHAVLGRIGTQNIAELPFGDLFRSPASMLLSVVLQVIVFVFTLWRMRPAATSSSRARDEYSNRGSSIDAATVVDSASCSDP